MELVDHHRGSQARRTSSDTVLHSGQYPFNIATGKSVQLGPTNNAQNNALNRP